MEKSRIVSAVSRFIDLIVAGLYWLICSLPVITIGAASTALYYAVVKCVRHERGRLTGVFFSAFRREFRQSTLTWLIYIGYTAVIALDAYAIGASGHGGGVLGILRWVFFLPADVFRLGITVVIVADDDAPFPPPILALPYGSVSGFSLSCHGFNSFPKMSSMKPPTMPEAVFCISDVTWV